MTTWKILCISYWAFFHNAHAKQHALFRLIQSWQKEVDESNFIGTRDYTDGPF